jgi:hypothetical protein
MNKNNIVYAPNGKRRKTSYKKGQILAIVPSTDKDLNISMSGKVVDMPIENIIAEEIPVLLTEEASNLLQQEEPVVAVQETQFTENNFDEPVMLFGKKIELNAIYSKTAFNLMGDRRQGGIHFHQNNTKTYR